MAPRSQPTTTGRETRGASLSPSNQAGWMGQGGEEEFAGKSAIELIRMAMELIRIQPLGASFEPLSREFQ
ncbi:unnamed protein product [Heligmosomoides polygyrus]|uniref:Uncharacterized protein n=1 Tax=Heligmosomoides polygyrus TaxID=6339 RepID=A0A183FKR8_HELPZ|nr:unnamed protein product [Heligmosomoides polygyrus]